MARRLLPLCQHLLQLSEPLRADSHAVVCYGKTDSPLNHFPLYQQLFGTLLFLETVADRILHDRLKDQLGNPVRKHQLRNIPLPLNSMVKADILDFNVSLDVLQFLRNRHHVGHLIQDVIKHSPERVNRKNNLLITPENRQRGNRLQRIIQEMGIDLGLQRLQLRLLLAHPYGVHFIDQIINLLCHMIKVLIQDINFLITAVFIYLDIEFTFSELLHAVAERPYRSGTLPADIDGDDDNQKNSDNACNHGEMADRFQLLPYLRQVNLVSYPPVIGLYLCKGKKHHIIDLIGCAFRTPVVFRTRKCAAGRIKQFALSVN